MSFRPQPLNIKLTRSTDTTVGCSSCGHLVIVKYGETLNMMTARCPSCNEYMIKNIYINGELPKVRK